MEHLGQYLDQYLGLWGQFAVAAALIIFAGVKLTKYGDIFSERLKLGHAFIGAVLIGWSTSLPELVLSIGTSAYEGVPDITMGNVVGSNLFNLFIIVLLDIYYFRGAILQQVKGLMSSAILSLVMVLAVGLFLCLPSFGGFAVGPINMGWNAVIIFVVYMLCMLALYMQDKQEDSHEEKYKDVSMGMLLLKCLLVVAVIVTTGLWLSNLSTQLQARYNLDEGFVGAFFLAIVSSLPEVITCFVAVRMGFHSMAIGTLFGSNIFNMGIISFCDLFYKTAEKPHIFNAVQAEKHLSSVLFVVLMTVTTIIFLKPDKTKKTWFVGIESVLIAILYVGALYLSYQQPNFLTPMWEKLLHIFA